jgi:hypothetical protein
MILTPWLNHRTNKAQKKNLSIRKSVAYSETLKIGIIFCNDDQSKIEAAERLGTLLKMDGKQVKTIAYERRNDIKHLPYDSITKENFSFLGNLIGKPITDFVNNEFDFLICFDEQPNNMVRNILANSKAKCRVGRFEESNQPSFEMLLENKKSEDTDWVDSIYKYLKIIS